MHDYNARVISLVIEYPVAAMLTHIGVNSTANHVITGIHSQTHDSTKKLETND